MKMSNGLGNLYWFMNAGKNYMNGGESRLVGSKICEIEHSFLFHQSILYVMLIEVE